MTSMSTPTVMPHVAKAFTSGPGRGAASRDSIAWRGEIIGAIPLFESVSKRHRRSIGRLARVSTFHSGERLVTEGKAGSVLGVVLDGTLRVVKKGRTVARLEAGSIFGEVAVLDPGPRTASVVAQTDGECLTIDGKDLWRLLSTEPAVGAEIARVLAGRLREVATGPD